MSADFSISGTPSELNQWRRNLSNFIEDEADQLAPLCLTILEIDPCGILEGGEGVDDTLVPGESFWLFPRGGVRGIKVRAGEAETETGSFEISLLSSANKEDWKLSDTLVGLAIKCGAQIRLDGEDIVADAEGGVNLASYEARYAASDLAALRASIERSDDKQVILPVGGLLWITVTADVLTAGDLPAQLARRIAPHGCPSGYRHADRR